MKLIELKLIGNELWEKHNFEGIKGIKTSLNDTHAWLFPIANPQWEKVISEKLGKPFIADEIED